MKEYIILSLLTILITSCAPKVEVETAKPVEEPIEEPKEIIEKQEEVIEEPEETSLEENIIEIKEDSFYPKEKIIEKNTEIKWVKKGRKDYKIGCYLEGTRVIQSPNLKQGDSFTYTFLKEGEYTCITTPYGLRSTITVEGRKVLLSPTGSAVIGESNNIKGASFAAIALIAIIILLFFIYGRKRQ